jgi:hypothetical protein
MRHKLGFFADDGVKVARRIAGAVLLVGRACGVPITCASFCVWLAGIGFRLDAPTRTQDGSIDTKFYSVTRSFGE